ncbi:MAG: hypothetical protein MR319_09860 [Mediterranea sp.]|nr:hypothetical protein [Mediterranea sp.]
MKRISSIPYQLPASFLPASYQRPTNSLSSPPLARSYRTDNERRCSGFGGK